MKNFFSCSFLLITLISCISSSAKEALRKGCEFGLSPTVNDYTLTMTSGFYGFYCYGSQEALTQVLFGNGDQMSWTTTDIPSTHVYVYPEAGDYTAQVWVNGQYYSDFAVVIADPNAPSCDSVFTCAPSFTSQLFYSEQKEKYFLTATRTDNCDSGEPNWQVGAVKYFSDTLQWFFPKAEEGSTVTVCLHLELSCSDSSIADTSSCEQILINQQNATLIDSISDNNIQFSISPTNFENSLQLTTKNFSSSILLCIYSLDGRRIFSEEIRPETSALTIGTENFMSGIYVAEAIEGSNFYCVKKIVKQ